MSTNHSPTETPSDPARTADEDRETLCLVAQLLDGWHSDGTCWSKHDEDVRQRLGEMQKRFEDERSPHMRGVLEMLEYDSDGVPVSWPSKDARDAALRGSIDTTTAALRREVEELRAALEAGQRNCDEAYDDLKKQRDQAMWFASNIRAKAKTLTELEGDMLDESFGKQFSDAMEALAVAVTSYTLPVDVFADRDTALASLAAVTEERDEFEARERDQYSLTELAERARDTALARAEAGAEDTARLTQLENLLRHCADITVAFNDDPDVECDDTANGFAPIGFRIVTAGCIGIRIDLGDTLRAAIDESMKEDDAATKGESQTL